MNLQAKRSVFLSRKGRARHLRRPTDLATVFMGQLLRVKNNKRYAKKVREEAREKVRAGRRNTRRKQEQPINLEWLFGRLPSQHTGETK